MKYFKKITDLPILDLQPELNRLLETSIISWTPGKGQLCINTTINKSDDPYHGVGSLYRKWSDAIDEQGNSKLETTKFSGEILKEEDFTMLCTRFKGTLFEEVYNALNEKYTLGRIRLMKSNPKSVLSWHLDDSSRLHYPIKTQEGCRMVIENYAEHLPQYEWTLANTVLYHTAFNGSFETRIHIVASILDDFDAL